MEEEGEGEQRATRPGVREGVLCWQVVCGKALSSEAPPPLYPSPHARPPPVGRYDSSELVTQMRAAHAAGKTTTGLDMYNGKVADMVELGVRESYKSKLQVLSSAAEAAEMILRVDDIIKCAPRQRE